jgi:hypothetical protein
MMVGGASREGPEPYPHYHPGDVEDLEEAEEDKQKAEALRRRQMVDATKDWRITVSDPYTGEHDVDLYNLNLVAVDGDGTELLIDAGWTRWSNCDAFDKDLHAQECGGVATEARRRLSHFAAGVRKTKEAVSAGVNASSAGHFGSQRNPHRFSMPGGDAGTAGRDAAKAATTAVAAAVAAAVDAGVPPDEAEAVAVPTEIQRDSYRNKIKSLMIALDRREQAEDIEGMIESMIEGGGSAYVAYEAMLASTWHEFIHTQCGPPRLPLKDMSVGGRGKYSTIYGGEQQPEQQLKLAKRCQQLQDYFDMVVKWSRERRSSRELRPVNLWTLASMRRFFPAISTEGLKAAEGIAAVGAAVAAAAPAVEVAGAAAAGAAAPAPAPALEDESDDDDDMI